MPEPTYRYTPDDEQAPDPLHAAMTATFNGITDARTGVQNDLAAARTGVQGDLRAPMTPWEAMAPGAAMGIPQAGQRPSTDALALAMGLSGGAGASAESSKDRAARILSGGAGAGLGLPLENAMGVQGARDRYDAARKAMLYGTNLVPDANTPPEIAANKFNYLDLLTLRGAGSPLAANIDGTGQDASTVDRRRAAVLAMSNYGSSLNVSAGERNRTALLGALGPPGASNTVDDVMRHYLGAGGLGLNADTAVKTLDAEGRERAAAAKPGKPDPLGEFDQTYKAYNGILATKDYTKARLFAQKFLGYKFDEKDPTTGERMPFTPEMLPGYTQEGAAAPVAGAAAAGDLASNTAAKGAGAQPAGTRAVQGGVTYEFDGKAWKPVK